MTLNWVQYLTFEAPQLRMLIWLHTPLFLLPVIVLRARGLRVEKQGIRASIGKASCVFFPRRTGFCILKSHLLLIYLLQLVHVKRVSVSFCNPVSATLNHKEEWWGSEGRKMYLYQIISRTRITILTLSNKEGKNGNGERMTYSSSHITW